MVVAVARVVPPVGDALAPEKRLQLGAAPAEQRAEQRDLTEFAHRAQRGEGGNIAAARQTQQQRFRGVVGVMGERHGDRCESPVIRESRRARGGFEVGAGGEAEFDFPERDVARPAEILAPERVLPGRFAAQSVIEMNRFQQGAAPAPAVQKQEQRGAVAAAGEARQQLFAAVRQQKRGNFVRNVHHDLRNPPNGSMLSLPTGKAIRQHGDNINDSHRRRNFQSAQIVRIS